MTRAAAIVVAILLAGCGDDESPAPPSGKTPSGMAPAVTVIPTPRSNTGSATWRAAVGQARPAYLEETSETAEEFAVIWSTRQAVGGAQPVPPAVDFAKERVAWVAQDAKSVGYKGVKLRRVEESVQGIIVEYVAVEPGVGRSYPPTDGGYVGFWVVVPRREGDVHFTRLVEHR